MVNVTRIDEDAPAQGVSFATIARQTDASITAQLQAMVQAVGRHEPVLSGAVSAIARLQFNTMPRGTQSLGLLQVLAPMITNVGQQLVNARDGVGQGAPKIPPANVQQAAFDALQSALAEAIVPTFVIQTQGDLVLVSIEVSSGKVHTHAAIVDVDEVRRSAAHVVGAHVSQSILAWSREHEAIHRALGGLLDGLTADAASQILLEHLAGILVKCAPTLDEALAVANGLPSDLGPAIRGGWATLRAEVAGHG